MSYKDIDFTSPCTLDEITVRTPVNIAVIKYWGKRDEHLNLPLYSSVSVTLSMSNMYSQTTARKAKQTLFCINGVQEQPSKRFERLIKKIEKEKRDSICVDITTFNTFPTAAGLASSASGLAALACSLKLLYNSSHDVSELARLGSGSACRSTQGGFVLWDKGVRADGSDSISTQLQPADHWAQLRILVCVVCKEQKPVPSTAGMQATVETSSLMKHRIANVQQKIDEIIGAIKSKDFPKFGEITMRDSNEMHACCLDTYPPVSYLNDISHQIIRFIHHYNSQQGVVSAAYTFDAGPNPVIFCEQKNCEAIKSLLSSNFYETGKITDIIECMVGDGPQMLCEG